MIILYTFTAAVHYSTFGFEKNSVQLVGPRSTAVVFNRGWNFFLVRNFDIQQKNVPELMSSLRKKNSDKCRNNVITVVLMYFTFLRTVHK